MPFLKTPALQAFLFLAHKSLTKTAMKLAA
jgi:hypothetical protein